MATVLRAWNVESDGLVEIPELPADQLGLFEEQLEDWLASQPDAIQDDLLVIGRQVSTPSGPLDILCLNSEGRAVVVELKRDLTPRQTVAQAIDYASWIALQSPDEIEHLATEFLKRSVSDAFQERFGTDLPEIQATEPTILVVAARLDGATERMIEFLSDRYGMDINGLTFRYIKLPSGERLLLRASVLSEDRNTQIRSGGQPSPENLIAMAKERSVLPQVIELRKLVEVLSEQPRKTYGGSFRYRQDGRVVCGVNVASYWGAPPGAIDVWLSQERWAEISGTSVDEITSILKSHFEFVQEIPGMEQTIFRTGSEESATQFVELLRGWTKGSSAEPAEVESGSDGKGDEANIPA